LNNEFVDHVVSQHCSRRARFFDPGPCSSVGMRPGSDRHTNGRDHYTFRLGYASREMRKSLFTYARSVACDWNCRTAERRIGQETTLLSQTERASAQRLCSRAAQLYTRD